MVLAGGEGPPLLVLYGDPDGSEFSSDWVAEPEVLPVPSGYFISEEAPEAVMGVCCRSCCNRRR